MHIAVMIAGVADPKRPIERPSSGKWADIVHTPTTPFKLSPFDEAALETALKFRDRDPGTLITALVTDGSSDLALMRAVAAYRIDYVRGLCPPVGQRGNPAWLARHALAAMHQPDRPVDALLIGREHGDMDDGMTAAYLAEYWAWPFVSQALHARSIDDGKLQFERVSTGQDESIVVPMPACASISNDKNNRLRHPLMKNVMMAKHQQFMVIAPDTTDADTAIAVMHCEPPATSPRGHTPCRLLQGSIAEQAGALVSYLKSSSSSAEPHAN
ncbi:hypothetical protein CR155_14140 [Pollutimonas nitritireducens]|uniref:Electron transfer flavoprotein alpha/beta-subunit N-terminal domain-containing protein n=1 Tax=Pollutimonas nitritireducens TaxID=2045209 RepID=A0A2N4UEE9_9BURK|nr:hypothetical protein [Pollutimonas nitritireducens]PLC53402.1 hypothetical protein CR155_14140 [Pollutimonas nitritireducens]